MRAKIFFLAGAAIGYVLGARAGRKRYEQIKKMSKKIWNTPGLQHQREQFEDFIAHKIGNIPGMILAPKSNKKAQSSDKELEHE